MTIRGCRCAYIFGVATHPAHRGQGLASRLISDLLENLNGFDLAVLVAEKPSLTAFYERFGFAVRGCLPDDGRNVLIKRLRGAGPDEQTYIELAREIKIFEDEE
jgi:predicted acetyltransferase